MEVTYHTLRKHTKELSVKLAPTAIVFIIASLYFPTTHHLYERWIKWDENLSHGLAIIGVFLLFIFRSSPWQPTKAFAPTQLLSLIFLALASCLWFLFHIINLYAFEQLMLLPLLFLLTINIYGWKVGAKHIVLLTLPIFAIPIWDQLTDPLVNLSGLAVGKMVQLIDIPANIDGNSIFIPSGHIVIADGCSGLRYLVISLALGYIISYLNNYSWKKIIFVLLISSSLALIANWLRIFILVLVGYKTNMQSSLMNDHEIFGWALFAAITFPAIYFAPVIHKKITPAKPDNTNQSIKYLFILPLLCITIGPALNLYIDIKPEASQLKDTLDYHLQPITPKKMPLKISAPLASHTENARTIDGIYIQIDQYQRATKTDKLVPYMTRLYNNESWSLLDTQAITLKGKQHSLSIFRHKTTGQKVSQIQWLDVSGYQTNSITIAKFLQVPALIQGKNHFMIATLQAKCTESSCDKAIAALKKNTLLLAINH